MADRPHPNERPARQVPKEKPRDMDAPDLKATRARMHRILHREARIVRRIIGLDA